MNTARVLLVTMGWPAAAAVSLSVAVGGREVTGLGLFLVMCGTAAAYGLDRLIDGRGRDPVDLRRVLAASVVSVLGAAAAGSAGRWGLAVTAVSLGVLAVLLARSPAKGVFRMLADGVVTALPEPLTLMFR